MTTPTETSAPAARTCSWCGRPESEVRLVAGPIANICEACVRLACAILGIQIQPDETPGGPPPAG